MNIGNSPIQQLKSKANNNIYIKREDLLLFSFGGNKFRKSALFFDEIDEGDYDCVVTYGSSSSNHCRVVANMAAERNFPCYIISPLESSEQTNNSLLMKMFGAVITVVPVDDVKETIDDLLDSLKAEGKKAYFIPGGGHGNIGTQAYVDCYEEISRFEREKNIHFDYIFHASGTGTTQAGLVCGQLMSKTRRRIVGISIARRNPRGKNVIIESIKDYFEHISYDISDDEIYAATEFDDSYIGQGYGDVLSEEIIKDVMINEGISLDPTYTGKAFAGMIDYLTKNKIQDKNVLFIHTGGTPLFFDFLIANESIC